MVARRLNRKTRIALAILILLIVAVPVLALRNCVVSVQEGKQLVAPHDPSYDRLVRLNSGTSVFLQSPTLARKVSQWLEREAGSDAAFEIADANFAANSSSLTGEGRSRVAQVAQILDADRKLRAEVLVLTDEAEGRPARDLELARARAIRSELLVRHVAASEATSESRAEASAGDYPVIDEPGQESRLFVVLVR